MSKKSQKLPSKVRVGYQNVDVLVCSHDIDGRLEDTEGFYQSSRAIILINERQCYSEQFATLIHECLHAIFYTYGMREVITDKEKEEYIVNTMSSAIIDLLRDNPALMDGIKHGY